MSDLAHEASCCFPGSESIETHIAGLLGEPVKINKQLIENRPDVVAECNRVSSDAPSALSNPRLPNLVIDSENTTHRLVLLLKLKGYTHTEIAKELGLSVPWISQIVRQPWFQERLALSLEEAHEEVLENILRVEARQSIATVIELRDNAKTEAVRLASAKELLDRYLGKPVQRSESEVTVAHKSVEASKLQEELEKVEAEIKQLTGGGSN